jgi:hypothetical protein
MGAVPRAKASGGLIGPPLAFARGIVPVSQSRMA